MIFPTPSSTRSAAALAALLVLAFPAVADDRADKQEKELKAALAQIVTTTTLKSARSGIAVARLDTGQVVYAYNADELLNPASNVKLFTAAAALARLGPEYRFDTEFYTEKDKEALQGGVLKGNLYVKGKGDPLLTTEKLWMIAGELQHQGVKQVKGDIIVDDSYFDAQREGPGYDQEKGDRSYLAPAGAVSFNFNSVAIHVAPGERPGDKGRVELEPMSDFFTVQNRTLTVAKKAARRVTPSSIADGNKQRVDVVGRLPVGSRDQTFYRRIDNPPVYFGFTLKKFLELRGVKVSGKPKRGVVPSNAKLFWVSESEALTEILRKLNKHSNNFIAEQLVKTIGAEVKGPPGAWGKGIEAVEDFLAEVGLARGSYVMKNGSGLNDTNRFSAKQTVTLLREVWKRFPIMAEYVASLPIAGKDGTIRWRMEGSDAVGRLRAKTGTLENVTTLSGYVETVGGEKYVFSVLVNDYPGRYAQVVRAVDAIGGALAAAGGPELGRAVASAQPAPASSGTVALADLKGHVATYYKLGLAGDKRNIPLLRTALRTEADPVLRAAVAEAIYLSDPDGETSERSFLENVPTDAASFGRLRALAAELDLPVPIVGSVADLAAQGNADALARLIDLAPIVHQEPQLEDAFADTFGEVARTAPEELLIALRTAPAPAADAALSAVARALVRSHEKDHPFPLTVKAALVHPDAEVAAFAKGLSPRLEERIQAVEAAMKAPTIGPPPTGPSPTKSERPGG